MTIDLDEIDWPRQLSGINEMAPDLKRAIYCSLVPDAVFERFNASPDETDRLHINAPQDTGSVEVRLYNEPGDYDPVIYVHLVDTLNHQIELLLLVINDPTSPRYNTDVTMDGLPTYFGTRGRNLAEELRAIDAGLAPGQVRRGLRLSGQALPTLERFIKRLKHTMLIINPLTYNNAIVYERYGFAYIQGKRRMEWIDSVLRPGGDYFERFDGTPFRPTKGWKSIRMRSWAIHDGILGEPFGEFRMYKRVGHHAGVDTFPDGVW
ncbi:MAG: hypothetical protein GYB68_18500 [Chloroflexi bacterium]|nr:hypothetical protein [Chloroflexota bacterium]